VSTFDGRIYSLDAGTGEVLPWVFQNEFGFVSSPLVANGVAYVGSFDRRLNAVPLGASEAAWSFEGGNWFWATPMLVDGVLYAPSLDGRLYALDAETGAAVWGTPYLAGEAIAAAPVRAGDSLVVVSKKGDVHVVTLASGLGARVPNPTNEKATTCNAEIVAAPCYHDGIVYVKAQNNTLFAIDPVARTVKYTFALEME
jgi:eukaryotic-like serine/threonine-protein kinase